MLPLDDYYYLLHAFDRLGRRFFPDWTGDEVVRRPVDPPDVIAAAREPFERRMAEVLAQYDAHKAAIAPITNADEIAAHQKAMSELLADRNECQRRLGSMVQLNDDYYRERHAFERREKAEALFFGALNSGALRAQFGHGVFIDWPTWSRECGFQYYLESSLVVAPRRISAVRRASALIRRVDFDKWLDATIPVNRAAEGAPPEPRDAQAACEVWLFKLKQANAGKPPPTRNATYEAAKGAVSELSERQFLRAWARVAPQDWKKGGRRPGS